jgi:transposase
MFTVELYAAIRRAVMADGLSRREASKRFGVHRNTITKMLQYSIPPGYRRRERPASKKLGPYMAWIDNILEGNRSVHKKQRHTAQRIFERLRDEEGFSGGYTIVREYVARALLRSREMFIPLSHCPGQAQADFGEADGYIAGKKVRFHYFCVDLPHSDGCFVKAYPAETAEAFCDGHVAAFDFFGGVPQSILYDNTRLAVAKIVKGGRRLRSQMFAELQSHYLFEDRFGRPGKGNDKGKVEGLVGYVRRNFMTPLPVAESFDALNIRLLDACTKRRQAILRGQSMTISERMQSDISAFMPLPPTPYDACHKIATRVSSMSLVRTATTITRFQPAMVIKRCWRRVTSTESRLSVAVRRSPCMRAATTRPSSFIIRCIISPCSNTRARRSIRPRRSTTGASPIASIVCGG